MSVVLPFFRCCLVPSPPPSRCLASIPHERDREEERSREVKKERSTHTCTHTHTHTLSLCRCFAYASFIFVLAASDIPYPDSQLKQVLTEAKALCRLYGTITLLYDDILGPTGEFPQSLRRVSCVVQTGQRGGGGGGRVDVDWREFEREVKREVGRENNFNYPHSTHNPF